MFRRSCTVLNNRPYTAFDLRPLIYGHRRAPSMHGLRRAAFDVRLSIFGLRCTAFDVRRWTYNLRRASNDVRQWPSIYDHRCTAFGVPSIWNHRCTAFDVRLAMFCFRCLPFDVRPLTYGLGRTVVVVCQTTYANRHTATAFDVRPSIFGCGHRRTPWTYGLRCTSFDLRRSMYGVRCTAFDGVRPSTHNFLRAVFDVRQTMYANRRTAKDG